VRRALLSVSDKTGVADLASRLKAAGVELLSTGGTYKALHDAGLEVTEVSAHTGSPEIMDGRVKTLHPKIHGGILGRRGIDDAVMAEQQIAPIDLVIVNLYPFKETIAQPGVSDDTAIENIDIGGPAMLRAAAKNHRDVWVVVDPADYELVADEITAGGSRFAERRHSALKAYQHTASYDSAVADYLRVQELETLSSTAADSTAAARRAAELVLPQTYTQSYTKKLAMRYGENPHQRAAFYVEDQPAPGTIASFEQLQGKALSYNNIADTDAALECVKVFDGPACVIVKHANPCGVACATTALEAYEGAFATDTTSAFGGIIAFNVSVDGPTLAAILERQFVEVVIAPEIEPSAREVAARKKNVRLLQTGAFASGAAANVRDFKRVGGGLLVQDADQTALIESELKVVTHRTPTVSEHADLMFAWKVAWFVKSNAIVYARDQQTIGVGAGQMARVISAKIAGMKAAEEGLEVPGSVMASDAFFPFRDGIDAAAQAGIRAIIQPGGSMRDEEVIAAANEQDIAMVFTGMRHFRH